jgi:methanogen homocitrate synthase
MYPYTWDLIGQKGVEVVLGKKSGRDSVIYKLKQLSLEPPEDDIDKLLMQVKEESIKRKSPISDEDLKAIFSRYMHTPT